MNIKLTSIPVKDPIAAFKFYTEILDFQEEMYMPEASLAIVVSKDDPKGTALMLEPSTDFYETFQNIANEKGLPVIVLGSDDVAAEYKKLKEKGVVFKQEPTKTKWGILAVFDDTCGNFIQIHQEL